MRMLHPGNISASGESWCAAAYNPALEAVDGIHRVGSGAKLTMETKTKNLLLIPSGAPHQVN